MHPYFISIKRYINIFCSINNFDILKFKKQTIFLKIITMYNFSEPAKWARMIINQSLQLLINLHSRGIMEYAPGTVLRRGGCKCIIGVRGYLAEAWNFIFSNNEGQSIWDLTNLNKKRESITFLRFSIEFILKRMSLDSNNLIVLRNPTENVQCRRNLLCILSRLNVCVMRSPDCIIPNHCRQDYCTAVSWSRRTGIQQCFLQHNLVFLKNFLLPWCSSSIVVMMYSFSR